MALQLGRLTVKLEADAGGLLSGLAGAAKAVEKFAKQTKEAAANIAGSAGALAAMGTAAVALASTVDLRTKRSVDELRKSSALLAVQVADLLMPAVRELSAMFKRAAVAVAGLSPELKAQLSHWAVMVVQVAAVAKAIQMVMSVVAPLAQAFSGLFGRFEGATLTGVVSTLLGVAAVVGGIIAVVALLHKAWRENWSGIQEATGSVIGQMREWLGNFFAWVGRGWAFLVDLAIGWANSMLDVVQAFGEATGVGPDKSTIAGMREGFAGLSKDLKSGAFLTDAWTATIKAGKEAGAVIADEWQRIFKELHLDQYWEKAKALFRGGGAPRAPSLVERSVSSGHEGMADLALVAQEADQLRERFEFLKEELGPAAAGLGELSPKSLAAAEALYKMQAAAEEAAAEEIRQKAANAARRLAEEQAQQREMWSSVGQTAVNGMTGAMGALGDVIQSGIQGAQMGGIWGAIAAVFFKLLQASQAAARFLGGALEFVTRVANMVGDAFASVFEAIGELFEPLMGILKPVLASLKPVFDLVATVLRDLGGLFSTIGNLLQMLEPIMKMLAPIMQLLAPLLFIVFKAVGAVINLIATILSPFIALVMLLTGSSTDAINGMFDNLKKSWEGLGDGWDTLGTSANDAAGGLDAVAAASDRVVASLLNVPDGYKVNAARFAAAIAEGDAAIPGVVPGSSGGAGGGSFQTPPITIQGDLVLTGMVDAADIAEQLHARVARWNGQRYGNPAGAPP